MRTLRHAKTKSKTKPSYERKTMNPHYRQRRPSRWSGSSTEEQAEKEKPLPQLTAKGYNSFMSWL